MTTSPEKFNLYNKGNFITINFINYIYIFAYVTKKRRFYFYSYISWHSTPFSYNFLLTGVSMTTSSLQYRPEPLVQREMAWRHIQEAFFIGRLWGYSRSSRAYSNLALFAQAADGIWHTGHAHSLHAASVIGRPFWLPLGVDFRYAEAGISGSSFVLGESVCLLPCTVPFYFSFKFFALYWCVLTRLCREGWPRARWTRRRTGTCVSTGRWTA